MPERIQKSPAAVVKELYDAFNAKDMARMRACWAEDAVYCSPGDGYRREGVDAIMEYTANGLIRPFPDARGTIQKMVVDGDQVVMDVTVEGTNTGSYARVTETGGIAEIPPTNRRFIGHGVEWFTVKDGKVVEDRIFFDRMELLTQLGLMPALPKA